MREGVYNMITEGTNCRRMAWVSYEVSYSSAPTSVSTDGFCSHCGVPFASGLQWQARNGTAFATREPDVVIHMYRFSAHRFAFTRIGPSEGEGGWGRSASLAFVSSLLPTSFSGLRCSASVGVPVLRGEAPGLGALALWTGGGDSLSALFALGGSATCGAGGAYFCSAPFAPF